MIRIWTLKIDESNDPDDAFDPFESLLNEHELARANRFYFNKDRRSFIAAHGLKRTMLSHYFQSPASSWQFDKEEKGRPFCIQPDKQPARFDFNISHTDGLVGCILSDQYRVSLDLENSTRGVDINGLAKRQFAPAEQTLLTGLATLEKRSAFFKIWTLKESHIKFTGEGLSASLSSFWFQFSNQGSVSLHSDNSLEKAADSYRLFSPTAEHQGAWACSRSEKADIQHFNKAFELLAFSEQNGE